MSTVGLEQITRQLLVQIYGTSRWHNGNIFYVDYCDAIRVKSHYNNPDDWRWHAAMLHDVLGTNKLSLIDLKDKGYPTEVLATLKLLDKFYPTHTEWVTAICGCGNDVAIVIALQRSQFVLENLNEFNATHSMEAKHRWTVGEFTRALATN